MYSLYYVCHAMLCICSQTQPMPIPGPFPRPTIQMSPLCLPTKEKSNRPKSSSGTIAIVTSFVLFYLFFFSTKNSQYLDGFPQSTAVYNRNNERAAFIRFPSVVNASSRWIIHNAAPPGRGLRRGQLGEPPFERLQVVTVPALESKVQYSWVVSRLQGGGLAVAGPARLSLPRTCKALRCSGSPCRRWMINVVPRGVDRILKG